MFNSKYKKRGLRQQMSISSHDPLDIMAVLSLLKLLLSLTAFCSFANAIVFHSEFNTSGIVSEREATRGQFPYSAVLTKPSNYFYFCGASIISNFNVITSAHCVVQYQSRPFDLLIGYDTLDLNQRAEFVGVSQIQCHPSYHEERFNHDIAVVKTSSQIIFSPYVNPIPLPVNDLPEQREFSAFYTGWGALWVSWD